MKSSKENGRTFKKQLIAKLKFSGGCNASAVVATPETHAKLKYANYVQMTYYLFAK